MKFDIILSAKGRQFLADFQQKKYAQFFVCFHSHFIESL